MTYGAVLTNTHTHTNTDTQTHTTRTHSYHHTLSHPHTLSHTPLTHTHTNTNTHIYMNTHTTTHTLPHTHTTTHTLDLPHTHSHRHTHWQHTPARQNASFVLFQVYLCRCRLSVGQRNFHVKTPHLNAFHSTRFMMEWWTAQMGLMNLTQPG